MLYYKMKGNKTCKSKSSSFEVILSRLSYVLQVIMDNRPCHVLPRQLTIDIDIDNWAHCVPCNTFGEQREIYGWIRLFFKPP